MDMTGSRRIEAPRERVWDALNDPAVLHAAIPGCESVERTAPDAFAAKVAIRIGPMSAKFAGKVTLTNVNAPAGYTITGEGQGGAMGFARGSADVALAEEGPTTTLLTYDVKAQVGGKMAQLGARLVDSTAKSMADQFFDRFAAQVSQPVSQPAAAAPPASGQDTMADQTTAPASVVVGRREEPATVTGAPHRPPADPAAPPARVPAGPPTDTLANAPVSTPVNLLAGLLSTVPRQPLGMPINFWLGSAVMVVILALLFVVG